jgi:hypothetical protein
MSIEVPDPTYAELKDALMDVTAHLSAATSAYDKFVGRHNRRGQRDPFFETRYQDFAKSVDRGRAVLFRAWREEK